VHAARDTLGRCSVRQSLLPKDFLSMHSYERRVWRIAERDAPIAISQPPNNPCRLRRLVLMQHYVRHSGGRELYSDGPKRRASAVRGDTDAPRQIYGDRDSRCTR